jgi:hypothetical protein
MNRSPTPTRTPHLQQTTRPSRDDTATRTCPTCHGSFTPAGRQTYCRPACRKTAFRRRHQQPLTAVVVPAARHRREFTIYECTTCGDRLLGEQRCPTCGIFARRLDIGGSCPHCAQPVTLQDLLDQDAIPVLTSK